EVPPGRESIVRAPVSGVLAIQSKKTPAIGDAVMPGGQMLSLQMFLSPTEIAQLVQAKEETDIQIDQAYVSMQLAENQLRAIANAQDTVTATRLNELRDQFERSKVALKEAR